MATSPPPQAGYVGPASPHGVVSVTGLLMIDAQLGAHLALVLKGRLDLYVA